MEQEPFATRLVQAMEEAGLKQADLVRLAGEAGEKLGKSQVSQYVSGKVEPRPAALALLARLLGTSAEWLAGIQPGQEARASARPAAAPTPATRLAPPTTGIQGHAAPTTGSIPMRQFKKSNKLDNVLYDVRGPVVDEAARMEAEGERILKLNIGNPAPFGFRTPDEVVKDMRQQLTECEGYSDSRGLFSARKAIMQYAQVKGLPNVNMEDIYTGNGVSELIQLSMHALLDDGDEILIPSPDYPLWTACATSRPTGTPTSPTWRPRSPTAPRPSSSSTPTTPRAPSTRARCSSRSSTSPVATSS